MRLVGIGLALGTGALVATLGALGAWAWLGVLPPSKPAPGLRIAGQTLPPAVDLTQWLQARASDLEGREIEVRLPGDHQGARTTLGALGISMKVATMLGHARRVGRAGSWWTRWDQLQRARRGELEVPLMVDVDPARAWRFLAPLKDEWDSPARPARLDLDTNEVIPHEPGRFLDLDRLLVELERTALEARDHLVLPVTEVPPSADAALLSRLDLGALVAEYVTHFGGDPNRALNIQSAAQKLDGVVLMPEEVFSFNQSVGARTRENGFREGWEIYRGEMVRGVGGGTCQVASTLHAAALYAGLDIIERYPHSRPSEYIGLGLDSTVSWPAVDLKLRNAWEFPIVVDTEVTRSSLRVSLRGARQPAAVEFGRETLAVLPYRRKVTESDGVEPGTIIRKQKGIPGYHIRRVRRIVVQGAERIETTFDWYPATPEHLFVPKGVDPEAVLPPLPGEEVYEPGDEAAVALAPDEARISTPACPDCLGESGYVIIDNKRFRPR